MKMIAATSALLLVTACVSDPRPATPLARDALADTLAGRVASAPQQCVPQRDLGGNRSIGEGAILFKGRTSRTVYVNRPPAGCPEIGDGRAMRVRTTSSQLCAGDIIEVFDPLSNIGYGSCGLGEFTPYRRAE